MIVIILIAGAENHFTPVLSNADHAKQVSVRDRERDCLRDCEPHKGAPSGKVARSTGVGRRALLSACGSRLSISRSHAHDLSLVSRSSLRSPPGIFEQERDCSQCTGDCSQCTGVSR